MVVEILRRKFRQPSTTGNERASVLQGRAVNIILAGGFELLHFMQVFDTLKGCQLKCLRVPTHGKKPVCTALLCDVSAQELFTRNRKALQSSVTFSWVHFRFLFLSVSVPSVVCFWVGIVTSLVKQNKLTTLGGHIVHWLPSVMYARLFSDIFGMIPLI